MKSLFGGSAMIAIALLAGSLMFSAQPLAAETLFFHSQQQTNKPTADGLTPTTQGGAIGALASRLTNEAIATAPSEDVAAPPTHLWQLPTVFEVRRLVVSEWLRA